MHNLQSYPPAASMSFQKKIEEEEQEEKQYEREHNAKIKNYRERMEAIYLKYDPAKVNKVEKALQLYKGYEEEAIEQLAAHYEASRSNRNYVEEEHLEGERNNDNITDNNHNNHNKNSDNTNSNSSSIIMSSAKGNETWGESPITSRNELTKRELSTSGATTHKALRQTSSFRGEIWSRVALHNALYKEQLLRVRYWHNWERFCETRKQRELKELLQQQQEQQEQQQEQKTLQPLVTVLREAAKDVKLIKELHYLNSNDNKVSDWNGYCNNDDSTKIKSGDDETQDAKIRMNNKTNNMEENVKNRLYDNLLEKCLAVSEVNNSNEEIVECIIELLETMHTALRDALLVAHELHDTKIYADALETRIEEIEPLVEKYNEMQANIADALHVNKILQQELQSNDVNSNNNSSSDNNENNNDNCNEVTVQLPKRKCTSKGEEETYCKDKHEKDMTQTVQLSPHSRSTSSKHNISTHEQQKSKSRLASEILNCSLPTSTSSSSLKAATLPLLEKEQEEQHTWQREQEQQRLHHHSSIHINEKTKVAEQSYTHRLPQRATFSEPMLYLTPQRSRNKAARLRHSTQFINITPIKKENNRYALTSIDKSNNEGVNTTPKTHNTSALLEQEKHAYNTESHLHEVERGECPLCKCTLLSCHPAMYGPANEKAAFCLMCKQAFTFADLSLRDFQST